MSTSYSPNTNKDFDYQQMSTQDNESTTATNDEEKAAESSPMKAVNKVNSLSINETEEDDQSESYQTNLLSKGIPMVIELPKDMLTAYILCQLTGKWSTLSLKSKVCIVIGLIGVYLMQLMVFGAYMSGIDFHQLRSIGDVSGRTWWYNLVALSVTFMYLWSDVISFYNSVWFWMNKVEEQKGFHTLSRFTNIKSMGSDLRKLTHPMNIKLNDVIESAKFWQYRLGLVYIFVLYAGFAFYSIIAIGTTPSDDIIAKIQVGLSVFFVLAIDDCAALLFILEPGILDKADFDVAITINETQTESFKRRERRLLSTTIILIISLVLTYAISAI